MELEHQRARCKLWVRLHVAAVWKVDTDGKVGAYLEERVNVGVNFILSAELDHVKKDYKFGFGMTVGE